MTSTIFSSKEFKPLFKWAFRRNRTIMIIFSILLGLGLILNLYVMATDGYYDDDAIPVTLIFYEAGAAFFTFISALKTFSFLHNKRSVDMFGALPTNRTTMFVSHLAAGISAVALPFSIGSVIIMGVATRSGESFKAGVFMIFTALLMIAAAYTFTALIAYCCGTVVDTAIVTIAANGIWVGMILLYFGFLAEMIPGFEFESVIFSSPVLSALAPYGFSVADLIYYFESSSTAVAANIIWQLIFTVGIFFLTVYVCRHRKAESSQNGFAFNWLPMVIKAGASIVAGGFIGFIAAEAADAGYSNMYIFAFWYLIIGFTAYFILHLIFSRGLKGKFLPQAIVFGSTSAAIIILVFTMTYGMGIDVYVPSANSISSVEFDYCTFKEPENIEMVTEIHRLIAEGVRDDEGYPYYFGYQSSDYYDYSYSYGSDGRYYNGDEDVTDKVQENREKYTYVNEATFNFKYKKKFGFSVCRSYYISSSSNDYLYYDMDKMNELIKKLRATEEYKKSQYPDLFDEEIMKNNVVVSAGLSYNMYTDSYNDYTSTGYAELPTNEAFINGLLDAYRKDVLADDLSESSNPKVGTVYCEINLKLRRKNDKSKSSSNFNSDYQYPVKESYKNTLDYIEKANIKRVDTPQAGEYELYYSSYVNFGYSGDYEDLRVYVDEAAPAWEYASCKTAGVEDYSQWHEDNYISYVAALRLQAKALYDEYIDDDMYFSPSYNNDYMRETGDYGEYFQLEDVITDKLRAYSDEYVQNTLTKEDGKASDKSDNSDIDSKTESKAETSSISSDKDSDTASKSESAAAETI